MPDAAPAAEAAPVAAPEVQPDTAKQAPEEANKAPANASAGAEASQAEPQEEQRYDAGGNPIRRRAKAKAAEPKKAPEPEEKAEEHDDGGAESAPVEDEESLAEGADSGEAEAPGLDDGEQPSDDEPDDVSSIGDETEFEVDGEKVTFKTLKEALAKAPEADRIHAIAQRALNAIASHKEKAVLDIFTTLSGGDREKGLLELHSMGARILAGLGAGQRGEDLQRAGLLVPPGVPEDIAAQAVALVELLADYKNMPPEKRELLLERRQRETVEEKLARMEEEARQRTYDQQVSEHFARLQEEVPAAMAQHGIPDNNETIGMIKDIMLQASQAGTPMTPLEAVATLKARFERERRAALSTMSLADIPESIRSQLRQEDIARVKNQRNPTRAPQVGAAQSGQRHKLPERRTTFG